MSLWGVVQNMSLDKPPSDNLTLIRASAGLDRSDVSELIAFQLREMSEHALRAGLGVSSSLIEVAALMVEMEGDSDNQFTD
jgi:hypothetical protein